MAPRYIFDIYIAFNEISRQIKKLVETRPSDYMVSGDTARGLDMMRFAQSRKIPFDAVT